MGSAIEFGVVLLLVSLVLILARRSKKNSSSSGKEATSGSLRRQSWTRLANNTQASLLLLFGLSLGLQLLTASLGGIPAPAVQDEFSYLLQADTFAQGRLTNPTHPLADVLSTPHVIQEPSYQSKYPPGQGVVLALGQVLIGVPIAGVWLVQAVTCGAIYWALRGWAPPRWALLGGFLAAFCYAMITRWSMTYWGGGLAALGGSLAFGSIPRIACNPNWKHGVLLGSGVGLWSVTRPYEGLLACVPLAVELVLILWRQHGTARKATLLRVLPAAMAPLCVVFAAHAVYNAQVTGSALQMPYQVWSQQSHGSGVDAILWSGSAAESFNATLDLSEHKGLLTKLLRQFSFYATPSLIPALLAAPFLWRCRKTRFAFWGGGFVLLGVLAESTAGHPHYTAPVAILFWAVAIQGFRRLRVWRFQDRPVGLRLAQVLPIVYVGSALMALVVEWSPNPYPSGHAWSQDRALLARGFEELPGRHLALVKYSPSHVSHYEWTYNAANIDQAKVVWVRFDPSQNERVLEYFEDRDI